MDDHRSADALIDAALQRDLEAVLAVDPSPEFVARVRTRVHSERDASWSPWRWGFAAAAGAIVVVAALIVGGSGPSRSPMAQDVSPAPRKSSVPVAEGPSTTRPEPVAARALRAGFSPTKRAASARRRARSEPEMIVAAGEARALRRLFANAGKGLVDLSSLQEAVPATAALQPPSGITFQPITFEPIAVEPPEEGERQ